MTHEEHPIVLIGATEKKFTEALWEAPIPSGQNRYYDGMLYLTSLMHCGGQFKIWKPK